MPDTPLPDPTPPPAESADGVTPPPPDAEAFFRDYYQRLDDIPSGKTDEEIKAFEQKFGTGAGLSKEKLRELAKKVRAELRATAKSDGEGKKKSGRARSRLAKAGPSVAIGVFVAAALTLLSRVVGLYQKGATWEELKPYVIGVVAVIGILLGLSALREAIKSARLSDRAKAGYTHVIVGVFVLVVVSAGLWVIWSLAQDAGIAPKPKKAATHPSVDIPFGEAFSYTDDKVLPDALFGSLKDDIGKPRDWMRDIEYGAPAFLGSPKARHVWLLTAEQANSKYTAHVYTGTDDDIVIFAFLLEPRESGDYHISMIPLRQQHSSSKSVYLFDIPACDKPASILVYMGLTEGTFQVLTDGRKRFRIRSAPL